MGYLVCKECNGYYELKEGESTYDFTSCECGGKLTYFDSLKDIDKNYGALEKSEICPSCGKKNIPESNYCENCGNKLSSETDGVKDKGLNKNKPSSLTKKFTIRFVGIIIGIIIIFLAESFLSHTSYVYLLFIVIGGLVASFIAGGRVRDGVLNGLLVGLIGAALSLFYLGKNPSYGLVGIVGLVGYILGYSFLTMVLSLIGGLIGIFLENYLKKMNIRGFN